MPRNTALATDNVGVPDRSQQHFAPDGTMLTIRTVFYHLYVACVLGANAVILIPQGGGGGSLFQLSWIALLGVSVLALLTIQHHNVPNLLFALSFCTFVLVSAIWSVNPTSTLTYGSLLCGNFAVAYMISCDYGFARALRLLSRVILTLTVLGLVAYAARLSFAFYFDHQSRANLLGLQPLRGFFPHKITGGLYAVLGLILTARLHSGVPRLAAISVYTVFIVLTGSATALVLGAVAVFVLIGVHTAVRSSMRPSVFFTLASVVISATGFTVATNRTAVLDSLGRDDTLTGRTYLWEYGLRTWSERPILGWGFNGYFESGLSDYIRNIGVFANYDVPHFHQAYIQTMVDLGLIGLVVLVVMIAFCLYASYDCALSRGTDIGIAAFALTAAIAVAGFVVYVTIDYNHFATFSLFLLFFCLRKLRGTPASARR